VIKSVFLNRIQLVSL